jgi:hypothetical protein
MRIGRHAHCGFFERGNCWVFKFRIVRFATCTFYSFWRFYLSVDKRRAKA